MAVRFRRLLVALTLVLVAPGCADRGSALIGDASDSATADDDADTVTPDAAVTDGTTPDDTADTSLPDSGPLDDTVTLDSAPLEDTTATDSDAADSDAADSDAADVTPPDTSADVVHDTVSNGTVTVGDPGRILLLGVVVTPDVSFDGEVLVVGSHIACVAPGSTCAATAEAQGATIIDTGGGVIAPGFIDAHNHILFDIFDDSDWLPSKTYTNHSQWPTEDRYKAMLDVKQCLEDASQGKPTWCPTSYDGAGSLKCELDKWGELKGMIAGTTSIVGLPGTSSGCFGSLSRSIDTAQNGLDAGDHIQTSALFPPSASAGDGVCGNFDTLKTNAYLIHCGEGTDAKALAEFAKLGTLTTVDDCLYAAQTVITHGTAFTTTEFAVMADADMKLTWSPASNVALYGATANIPAALDAGVLVTLAPDWSMGGSQNILDEMRFASAWDDGHFGDRLSARDLVFMTTQNAAIALALDDRIGTLAPGFLADIVVVAGSGDPYAVLVAARPVDVMLTMIGGRVLYGDAVIQLAAAPAPPCEAIDVCGAPKFLCVAESSSADKLNQTYAQIKTTLEAALVDLDGVATNGYEFAPLAPLVHCD